MIQDGAHWGEITVSTRLLFFLSPTQCWLVSVCTLAPSRRLPWLEDSQGSTHWVLSQDSPSPCRNFPGGSSGWLQPSALSPLSQTKKWNISVNFSFIQSLLSSPRPLWESTVCVSWSRLWCLVVWPNTSPDVVLKVFFRWDWHLKQ